MLARLILSVSFIFMAASLAHAGNPVGFAYQGRLMNETGEPLTGTATLLFQILDPTGTCILYEETQATNLATDGTFTAEVGSFTTSAKRTAGDRGHSMTTIFSNLLSMSAGGASCTGSSYSPASGDRRKLRVTVSHSGLTETLSPDQILNAVPFATTAETLQGKQPGDFLQVSTGAGAVLTQSNLQQVFSSSAYFNKLLAFLAGSAATDVGGQRLTSVATPTATTDATNKGYADSKLGGRDLATTSPSTGQVLTWNASTSRWEPTTIPAHATGPIVACSSGQASKWDGSQWGCVSVSGGGGGGGYGGAGTFNGDNTQLVLTSGSEKVQMVKITTAGSVKLPDATTFSSTGGPIFQLMNAASVEIPILDFTGNLVGRLPPNSNTDLYLFEKTTPSGKWLATNLPTSTMTLIKRTLSLADSPYNSAVSSLKIDASTLLIAYVKDNGDSTYSMKASLVTIDETTNAVTLLATSTVGTPFTYQWSYPYLYSLSPGHAILVWNYDGANNTAAEITKSGSTISVLGTVGLPSGCNWFKYGKDALYCNSGSDTHKLSTGPATVTYSGYTGWNDVGSLGGMDLFVRCDASSPSLVVAERVNMTTQSILQTLTIPNSDTCWLWGNYKESRHIQELDANNIWVFSGNSPAKYTKLNWNGSVMAVVQAPTALETDVGGAGILSIGSDQYLVAPSGTSKAKITDIATLAHEAPSLWADCYGPYISSPNRCITHSVSGNSLDFDFKITR